MFIWIGLSFYLHKAWSRRISSLYGNGYVSYPGSEYATIGIVFNMTHGWYALPNQYFSRMTITYAVAPSDSRNRHHLTLEQGSVLSSTQSQSPNNDQTALLNYLPRRPSFPPQSCDHDSRMVAALDLGLCVVC